MLRFLVLGVYSIPPVGKSIQTLINLNKIITRNRGKVIYTPYHSIAILITVIVSAYFMPSIKARVIRFIYQFLLRKATLRVQGRRGIFSEQHIGYLIE
ncbi:hypothetical protein D3C81_186100 [compost metagenome]